MPKRKPRRPALNQQIREARLAAKMHQRELAAKIGATQQFVQLLEAGTTSPNVRHLIAICKATGCEFSIDRKTVIVAK